MLDLKKQPAGPETVLIGVHILSKKGDFTTLAKSEARFLPFHRHRCNVE